MITKFNEFRKLNESKTADYSIYSLEPEQFRQLIEWLEADISMYGYDDIQYYADETGLDIEQLHLLYATYGWRQGHRYDERTKELKAKYYGALQERSTAAEYASSQPLPTITNEFRNRIEYLNIREVLPELLKMAEHEHGEVTYKVSGNKIKADVNWNVFSDRTALSYLKRFLEYLGIESHIKTEYEGIVGQVLYFDASEVIRIQDTQN